MIATALQHITVELFDRIFEKKWPKSSAGPSAPFDTTRANGAKYIPQLLHGCPASVGLPAEYNNPDEKAWGSSPSLGKQAGTSTHSCGSCNGPAPLRAGENEHAGLGGRA